MKQALLLAILGYLQVLAQSQPMQEGFVEVPGARIHYKDSGGHGVPVIFLHANTGTADAWEKQIPAFTGAGYRFVAYDRRGWGQSPAGPSGPASTGADDLLALADHLKIDKFHLVSTAGGGFIGVDFVLSYPQRLRSFTLNCSTSGITDPDYVAATRRMRPEVFTKLPNTFLELSPSYRFANPEGVARWSSFEEKSRPPEALRSPAQPPKNKITLAALESIKLPTLVIAGDADLYAPPALMHRVAERVKGAQFITVPDAGHSCGGKRRTSLIVPSSRSSASTERFRPRRDDLRPTPVGLAKTPWQPRPYEDHLSGVRYEVKTQMTAQEVRTYIGYPPQ